MKEVKEVKEIKEIIYTPLLNEENTFRPIPAIYITETMYELQGKDLYEQLNEKWQFVPGDIGLVEYRQIGRLSCLVAVEKVGRNDYLCTLKSNANA
jgi:hypothetical protein